MAKRFIGQILAAVLLAAALFSFSPGRASALSCAMDESSPLEKLQQADVVLVGAVISKAESAGPIKGNGDLPYQSYRIRVDDAVKNVSDSEVLVYVNETWGTSLEKDGKYIMLLDEQDGKLVAPLCATTFVRTDWDDYASYSALLDDVRDGSVATGKSWLEGNKIVFLFAGLISTGLVLVIWKRSK